MPDFNIKFKYEGAGKAAANARTKAISASKNAAKSPSQNQTQRPVEQNRELVSSIKNLTSAVKSLERSMRKGGGGSGGGGGNIPSGSGLRGGPGFGGVGSSLPLVGAGIALLGFAVQKINQVGNAYIDLTSRQAGSVGVAGFQTGRRGAYLQTEQGAMVKAHRMAGGRFSGGVSDRAVQVGSIFGMSSEELGTISGRYARTGGNLGRAVSVARGAGIETELPMFMQGMSSILEEAITNGVNASNLADDLGDQVAMITQRTGTQSVGMALNIVKNMRGVQQQVSRGQIGGYEQFVAYRAAGSAINRRLANTQQRDEYLTSIINRGLVSQEEVNAARSRAQSAGRGLTLEDLEASGTNIGPILRRAYAARGGADVNEAAMSFHRRTLGEGAAGFRRWASLNTTGMGINEAAAAWQGIGQRLQTGTEQRGAQAIQQRFQGTEESSAFMSLGRRAARESLVMDQKHFADLTLSLERGMISLANAVSPTEASIANLKKEIKALGEQASGLVDVLNGRRSFGNWLTTSNPEGPVARIYRWVTE